MARDNFRRINLAADAPRFSAAPAFASNHGLGMTITQFDFTNRPAYRSFEELSSRGSPRFEVLGRAPGSRIAQSERQLGRDRSQVRASSP